jgi:hypothetical protein
MLAEHQMRYGSVSIKLHSAPQSSHTTGACMNSDKLKGQQTHILLSTSTQRYVLFGWEGEKNDTHHLIVTLICLSQTQLISHNLNVYVMQPKATSFWS